MPSGWCLGVLLLMLAAPGFPARADDRQYKVEAAFLYNFFNYIVWPGYHTSDEMKQATICTDSADPVASYLDYIARTRRQERALTVRPWSIDGDVEGCQLIYVRNLNDSALHRLQPLTSGKGVLLVSSTPHFIENGGMVQLEKSEEEDGGHVLIEINNTALKAANFQVSSRLLSLAAQVL